MTERSAERIKADEAWKEQVKAEDAALDAQRTAGAAGEPLSAAEAATQPASGDGPPDIDPSQMPPPTLSTLISMLSTQAMAALGMLPDPVTGQPEPRMHFARHFIDMLGALEEKTKGNLSGEEHALLDGSLHELRMAYVHLSRASK
jgi:hypothetical protein